MSRSACLSLSVATLNWARLIASSSSQLTVLDTSLPGAAAEMSDSLSSVCLFAFLHLFMLSIK